MTGVSGLKNFAVVAVLAAAAVALWLSAVSAGGAATATTTQGTTAQATKTISWETAAAGCTSDDAVAFGEMAPGASADSSTFTGCIRSNAAWSVAAEGTAAMTNGTETIPNSNLRIRVTSTPAGAGNGTVCDTFDDSCTLEQSRTLFTGANASPGNSTRSFSYAYRLSMPEGQPAGSYTGGQVTFTASN